MADNLCPVCGANPCYRICPTQDPYHGDQAAENADYEFNARYDDNRERYAATAADADTFYEDERHFCEFCGRDDTDIFYDGGCNCANGRALPAMTVGAVLKHKNTVNNDDDPTADDREPCAGGCGVMTEPYAPCGSEQCRDKSNDNTDDIPF